MNPRALVEKEIEFLQLQLQIYKGRDPRSHAHARVLRSRLNELNRLKAGNHFGEYLPASLTPIEARPTPIVLPPARRASREGFVLTLKVALGVYLGFLLSLITYMVLYNLGAFSSSN